MKVAVPVDGEALRFFPNAGHAPCFAVFAYAEQSLFKAFALEALRPNPRTDLDHRDDSHGHCDHADDEEHVRQHRIMAEALEDCDYLVTRKACKNSVEAMTNLGVRIKKYEGSALNAQQLLAELAGQLT